MRVATHSASVLFSLVLAINERIRLSAAEHPRNSPSLSTSPVLRAPEAFITTRALSPTPRYEQWVTKQTVLREYWVVDQARLRQLPSAPMSEIHLNSDLDSDEDSSVVPILCINLSSAEDSSTVLCCC